MAVKIVIYVLLTIGLIFTIIGVTGILRMPDVFGRLQASTCIASLGTICIVLSGVVYAVAYGLGASTCVKLIFVLLFVLGTNPISNHALLKGAYKMGVKPAKDFVIDDYKEDDPE